MRLLGEPEVLLDGHPVALRPGKQQELLVALALTPGAPVSADRLVDFLWSETPPASAATTLRGLVSRLRTLLGGEAGPVDRRGTGYVLDVAAADVDLHLFADLTARGRAAHAAGDPSRALSDFDAALALWRGSALGPVADEPFAKATAQRLTESRLDATEDAAHAEVALGRASAAVARLDPHLTQHPLRERACGLLMRALARLGRQADALAAYRSLRTTLATELGVDPTPELQELRNAILQQRAETSSPEPTTEFGDTVAFLFTDIESSTRRWEGDPETMATALADHDRRLAQACEQAGGRVFSHTGDGLCAAFPTAAAALNAAVAGQIALSGAAGPCSSLKVRMGVHVGAVERRAGNFFGPTLNRTARLMSVAGGGQVLCSAIAAGLAADRLGEGLGLRDLGEVRLPDLARPERVYQLTHPQLSTEFPALAVGGGPRTNLPNPLTTFVGRDELLAEATQALRTERLVTLSGPGGAGKTRLAVEVARSCLGERRDGAWFVDLSPLRDPELLPRHVAFAIGLDASALDGANKPLLGALTDALRHRHMLLVLDNCEHLVDAAANLAHALLSNCPDVVVLATSREVLAVPGETMIRVAGLALPGEGDTGADRLGRSEAVTLFCRRAAESTPGFALTDANAEAVARICVQLDGIPLALELAAARTRLLGARQLAARLNSLEFLSGGPRTADPRHRTLAATIAWSHDLLPEPERIVLRRLAVFPGSWTPGAAEAVAGKGTDTLEGPPPAEIFDIVSRLVDKSMVLPVPPTDAWAEHEEPRYRLLETIRQFAAARLDDVGETDATLARLHGHLVAVVEEGWPHEVLGAQRMRRLHPELDNVRAVLQWCLARGDDEAILALTVPLHSFWEYSASAEGIVWMRRAVTVSPALNPEGAVFARNCLALLMLNVAGEALDTREPLLWEAVALAEKCGASIAGGIAACMLADVLISAGRETEAHEAIVRAEELFRASPDFGAEYVLLEGARQPMMAGKWDVARSLLRDIIARASRRPEDGFVPLAQGLLALADAAEGRADTALETADSAVVAARAFPVRQVLTMALARAVEVRLVLGREQEVAAVLDELLAVLREQGSRRWVAESLELAAVVLATVDPDTAGRCLGAAAALRDAMGEHGWIIPDLAAMVANAEYVVAGALAERAPAARRDGAAMHFGEVLALARTTLAAVPTG